LKGGVKPPLREPADEGGVGDALNFSTFIAAFIVLLSIIKFIHQKVPSFINHISQ
jgi:hypothetical protein